MLIVVVNPGCLLRAVATHVDSMLINNKKESGKSDRLSFNPPTPSYLECSLLVQEKQTVQQTVQSTLQSGLHSPREKKTKNSHSLILHVTAAAEHFTLFGRHWFLPLRCCHGGNSYMHCTSWVVSLKAVLEGMARTNTDMGRNLSVVHKYYQTCCCVRPRFIKAVGYLNANWKTLMQKGKLF